MLEDIAILTGGTMVSADLGIKLENVTVSMLGRAKKVMIDKENTTIVGGAGKKADIQARITQIKVQIEETTIVSVIDPGCVKTHTSAKCRKNNSSTRHRAPRMQYSLTLRCAISPRCFYVYDERWSFHTTKTDLRQK
jgi:hypothetical protein